MTRGGVIHVRNAAAHEDGMENDKAKFTKLEHNTETKKQVEPEI